MQEVLTKLLFLLNKVSVEGFDERKQFQIRSEFWFCKEVSRKLEVEGRVAAMLRSTATRVRRLRSLPRQCIMVFGNGEELLSSNWLRLWVFRFRPRLKLEQKEGCGVVRRSKTSRWCSL